MYKNLQKNYKNPVKKVVVRRMGIIRKKNIMQVNKGLNIKFFYSDPIIINIL